MFPGIRIPGCFGRPKLHDTPNAALPDSARPQVLNQSVQYVTSEERSKRIRTGSRKGLAGMPINKYRTENYMVYTQEPMVMVLVDEDSNQGSYC